MGTFMSPSSAHSVTGSDKEIIFHASTERKNQILKSLRVLTKIGNLIFISKLQHRVIIPHTICKQTTHCFNATIWVVTKGVQCGTRSFICRMTGWFYNVITIDIIEGCFHLSYHGNKKTVVFFYRVGTLRFTGRKSAMLTTHPSTWKMT